IEKHRYYTDQERYEFCRRYKISGKTISEFAKENNIKRTTLRDWVNAYNNINGKFINVSTVAENENNIVENKDLRVNMLSEVEKIKKSSHFSRFDHSIVVIEYKGIKISTSLNQAERLLEKLYDNV
ncbi:MAG: helix-turn-helix domain containing protein, partial [Erysipelotrichaceae bacterium]|nr:helix-turn-helix domain containing protein [Erysipelotrichaceae bacterium]